MQYFSQQAAYLLKRFGFYYESVEILQDKNHPVLLKGNITLLSPSLLSYYLHSTNEKKFWTLKNFKILYTNDFLDNYSSLYQEIQVLKNVKVHSVQKLCERGSVAYIIQEYSAETGKELTIIIIIGCEKWKCVYTSRARQLWGDAKATF